MLIFGWQQMEFTLFARDFAGNSHSSTFDPDRDTIARIRSEIVEKTGHSGARVLYTGKQLEDHLTLQDYAICDFGLAVLSEGRDAAAARRRAASQLFCDELFGPPRSCRASAAVRPTK